MSLQTSLQSSSDPVEDCLTSASVVDLIAPEKLVEPPNTEPLSTPLTSRDEISPSLAEMPADIATDESATAILHILEVRDPVEHTSPSQTVAIETQELPSDAPPDGYLDAGSDTESDHATT